MKKLIVFLSLSLLIDVIAEDSSKQTALMIESRATSTPVKEVDKKENASSLSDIRISSIKEVASSDNYLKPHLNQPEEDRKLFFYGSIDGEPNTENHSNSHYQIDPKVSYSFGVSWRKEALSIDTCFSTLGSTPTGLSGAASYILYLTNTVLRPYISVGIGIEILKNPLNTYGFILPIFPIHVGVQGSFFFADVGYFSSFESIIASDKPKLPEFRYGIAF